MSTSRLTRKARRAAERLARKQPQSARQGASVIGDSADREGDSADREASSVVGALSGDTADPKGGADDREASSVLAGPPHPKTSSVITKAQLAANRANAQLSTGPVSQIGKAKSSKNALKTALTGRTVLLPEDDADRYEQHLKNYSKIYQPLGERECEVVQALADAAWRLDRIPGLEEALYVKGCHEFAAEVAELDPGARSSMLRMHTYLAYERQFRNLHIQETRLHRLREKLTAELKELQTEREQKEKDDLACAAKLYVAAKHDRKSFDPSDFGFDFSTEDVEAHLHGQRASFLTEKAMTGHGR